MRVGKRSEKKGKATDVKPDPKINGQEPRYINIHLRNGQSSRIDAAVSDEKGSNEHKIA